MSWSVSLVGTPEKVCQALDVYRKNLNGVSLEEYDEVLPGLKTIVQANASDYERVVHLEANGHSSRTGGVKTYASCNITLKPLGKLAA